VKPKCHCHLDVETPYPFFPAKGSRDARKEQEGRSFGGGTGSRQTTARHLVLRDEDGLLLDAALIGLARVLNVDAGELLGLKAPEIAFTDGDAETRRLWKKSRWCPRHPRRISAPSFGWLIRSSRSAPNTGVCVANPILEISSGSFRRVALLQEADFGAIWITGYWRVYRS
jgi:hypothetical protein